MDDKTEKFQSKNPHFQHRSQPTLPISDSQQRIHSPSSETTQKTNFSTKRHDPETPLSVTMPRATHQNGTIPPTIRVPQNRRSN